MDPNFGASKSAIVQKIRDEEFKRRLTLRDENEYNIDIGMSGTSATIVVLIGDMIYYGFIGDTLICLSKVMAGNASENTLNNDLILTKASHMPSDFKEKMRVYRRRGEVRGDI